MSKPDFDWGVLSGATVVLVLSLLVSGGLVMAGNYFRAEMQADFQQDNRQFQRESRRYLAVDEEEQVIREYLPKFRDYQQQGFIGAEHRLNWTEVLRQVSTRLKLPAMQFAIDPQETYAGEYNVNGGRYQVFSSAMQVRMGLLHEGDLVRFLDALSTQAHGRFTVESCSFARRASGLSFDADKIAYNKVTNLSANCELSWLTMRKPDDI